MSTTQIILLGLGVLIVYMYVKKYLTNRSLKHYDAPDLKEALKSNRNIVLLDVRTPAERKENHIKGSFHIPLHELGSRMSELQKFKEKEIVCYCRSGNRSVSAAAKLKKQGYDAANLRGGIIRWS